MQRLIFLDHEIKHLDVSKNIWIIYTLLFFRVLKKFLFYAGAQLINNVLVSVYSKVIQLYIYIYPLFFQILFPYRPLQCIEQSSLCYTVGSHQLSILYIVSVVYICQSQSPNSSHPTLSPLVSIHLFSMSVSTSALQIRSSIPFFQILHICINIQYLFFSF